MENNKQHKKEKKSWKKKKKEKKKNLWATFSLCTPRGPSAEEKQHMQEVRWDVRKAFSGSICQAREGKGARQTTRERERERERVSERDTQGPGETDVLGEQLVLFKSTVTVLSQIRLDLPTQQLYPAGLAL